ncbi:MAG TPA: two-component regulator propeller domain-containing protein [Bacteroidales bacterium]|nr:two-component regulator propeller domain-containing protein [Bacteroidales bacterium]
MLFRSKYFYLPLFFLILLPPVFSQEYFFEFYSEKDGLANPKVYSIVQDDNRLVWIGSAAGLSTFDGKVIKNLTVEDGLASGGVKTIFKDSRGHLWFGHLDGGISRYDGEKFKRTDNLLLKSDITSFCEDKNGHLWITSAGSGAIQIMNPTAPLSKLKYKKYSGDRLSSIIFGSVCLHDNTVCFITDLGIRAFNRKENNFDIYTLKDLPAYFQITCMFEDKDYNLWFGSYHGGLYKYSTKEKQVKIFDLRNGLASNWITTITQDKSGIIWVGHYETGGITKIVNDKLFAFDANNGLANCMVNGLEMDAEHNLLIATRDRGFAIFKGEVFTKFVNQDRLFPNTEIWKVLEDKQGKIWFGTNNGLVIYDPTMQTPYTLISGQLGKPTQIRHMAMDKSGNIWIGTDNKEIYLCNSTTKRIELAPFYADIDLSRVQLRVMAVDHSNNLWIGTSGYLYQYNLNTRVGNSYSQSNGLPKSPDISAIYVDANNYKYIGVLNQGITMFKDQLSPNSVRHYPLLSNTTPRCMVKDDKGYLWIGTENMGLLCFKDGAIIKRYTTRDGLLSNIINMVHYHRGFVFVGSNAGLNIINLKDSIISTYTQRNGFGIGMKSDAVILDKKEYLWFGTSNGAVRYNVDLDNSGEKYAGPYQEMKPKGQSSHKPSFTEPFTKIDRIIIGLDTIPIEQNKHFRFKSIITLQYMSVCLANPDQIEYKYMLEGGNNAWQKTRETSATFGLQPGRYTFKVLAKNYSGTWNSQPAEFTFYINPPFYRTWWFIVSMIVLGIILLFVFIKIRERNLIREKRVLEEKVIERTAEVVKMNDQLAIKNKDIVDSIQYASRIQNALLPPELPFDNTFVLFKPKDIVSGDFFWFIKQDNMEWYAAVDCTGHGVPGAFMSIVGHSSLNKIVQEYSVTQPSAILNHLNAEIAAALHQYHQDSQIHDGMDIALVSLDLNTHKLQYSGAFNPLWLMRNGELLETRANRYAIGLAPDIEKDFTNNEIQIESGDTIYLFSDGYADQFGGPNNVKLKVGKFKEILLSIQHLSMEEQKAYLDDYFEKWKGDFSQVDDVLVIGRRFVF